MRINENTDELMFMGNSYTPEFGAIEEEDESADDSFERKTSTAGRLDRKGAQIDQLKTASDAERKRILRDLFAEFDILLAQRDFEKTVDMLLKIIKHAQTLDAAQQLVYKQKQTELIQTLRRDLAQAKERGNSKGVVKTGKRVVNSLVKVSTHSSPVLGHFKTGFDSTI